MRIGIYARGLSQKEGGVKNFLLDLVTKIRDMNFKGHTFYVIHNAPKRFFKTTSSYSEILMKTQNKFYADFFLAPNIINTLQLEKKKKKKNVIPYGIKCAKVVIVHDLAYYLKQLNAYPLLDTLYMKWMIRSSSKRADKVIAVSENTKKDLKEILSIPENKVSVVHESVNGNFRKIKDTDILQKVKKKYELPDNFMLFTGGISPRKNIPRLLEAFSIFKEKNRIYKLVLTGSVGWKNNRENLLINSNVDIFKIGYVETEDMPVLYNLADLYLYPSLYEGFGLPILEAQACGCPVLTSNVTSCPEVAGDGAHIVNPYSEKEIVEGMQKILQDKMYREKLIRKGYKNLERFSWERSAKELLEVLENL